MWLWIESELNMTSRRVEIAGAGLSGLTLAAALGQQGWQVRIHERSKSLRSTGGGLYLREEARWAGRKLGIDHKLAERLFTPDGMEIRVEGVSKARFPREEATQTMLRQDLHDTLREAALSAGATIATDVEIVGADPDGSLIMASGERIKGDLVVAADGVSSKIPASLAIEGVIRRYDDGIVRVLLERGGLELSHWNRTIDFWHYGGAALRALYSPCGPAHCYLCLMSAVGDSRGAAVPVDTAYWSSGFPELAPLLARAGSSARYDRYGLIQRASWSSGRAVIIGDAAHAMPSSLGRSASIGMANAVELAVQLEAHDTIETALAAWELAQRPRIEAIQAKAESVALARSLSSGAQVDLSAIEREAASA
jgi:2-methyl-3-hydroxypyridine 5-carboxylic acid dioxygenase